MPRSSVISSARPQRNTLSSFPSRSVVSSRSLQQGGAPICREPRARQPHRLGPQYSGQAFLRIPTRSMALCSCRTQSVVSTLYCLAIVNRRDPTQGAVAEHPGERMQHDYGAVWGSTREAPHFLPLPPDVLPPALLSPAVR